MSGRLRLRSQAECTADNHANGIRRRGRDGASSTDVYVFVEGWTRDAQGIASQVGDGGQNAKVGSVVRTKQRRRGANGSGGARTFSWDARSEIGGSAYAAAAAAAAVY